MGNGRPDHVFCSYVVDLLDQRLQFSFEVTWAPYVVPPLPVGLAVVRTALPGTQVHHRTQRIVEANENDQRLDSALIPKLDRGTNRREGFSGVPARADASTRSASRSPAEVTRREQP